MTSHRVLVAALAGAVAMGLYSACGSDDGSSPFPPTGLDGGTTDESNPFVTNDAAPVILEIKPPNPVINFPAQPNQAFQAFVTGSTTPIPAAWSVDNALIGTIDNGGLFTPAGIIGGVTNVNATAGKASASTTVTVNLLLSENPGNVDATTQGKLKAGGKADSAFRWLYPYDQTIFPRGIDGPKMQFDGAAPDAVYVHITTKYLEYQGFFGASNPGRVSLSAASWKSITLSAGANDPVTVEVTKISGGAVTGPVKETWAIAQGSLKGTVYYNTYNSPQVNGTGAIMRIKPGTAADVYIGGCTVCHGVSSNGSTITSGIAWGNGNPLQSGTFPVGTNANPPPQYSENLGRYSFGALAPDGALVLTNGIPSQYTIRGLSGATTSELHDTKTGAKVAAPGFDGVVTYAVMPSFSPDGAKLVFNRYDTGQGHTLSVMDVTGGGKTYGGLVDVAHDQTHILGWPFFTPDAAHVLFHSGTDYGTENSTADLNVVDLATKTVTALSMMNGYNGSTNYLPYADAEAHKNYEPTVLPVAVGGYYWVVFTSRRVYGNVVGNNVNPYVQNSTRKKLWVSAIDINMTPGKDPSHPGFYLPGQEVDAGNMRGFWALDPCKQNGNTCETGDECCGGFCRSQTETDGATSLVCVPPPSGCAQEFEKCTTAADCCGFSKGYLCLNGHCAQPPPN